ncbi:MAG: FtsX-like permease family protein, partial [Actinoplanes sp.]
VFVLLIACINFMNLSTAQSVRRAKEVSLRKTIGASRSQLIGQFMIESAMIGVLAVIVSVMLLLLALPYFNRFTGKNLVFDILDPYLATTLSYLVLFVGTVLAAALLIDTSLLEQTLQRPVHPTDYLTLGWIISSMATVGGAIGSGLEDEETVRAAAYGYHPEPDGYREEKDRLPGGATS